MLASRVVYFVQAASGGPIKIGISADLDERLQGLQNMSPVPVVCLATIPGYAEEERALHREFSASRLYGEWFEETPELRDLIASIADGAPLPAPQRKTGQGEPQWRRWMRLRDLVRDQEERMRQRIEALKCEEKNLRAEIRSLRAEVRQERYGPSSEELEARERVRSMKQEMRGLKTGIERATKELKQAESSLGLKRRTCEDCGWPRFESDDDCTNCDYCRTCGAHLPNRQYSLCAACREGFFALETWAVSIVRRLDRITYGLDSTLARRPIERAASLSRKRTTHLRTVEMLRLVAECLDFIDTSCSVKEMES